MELAFDRQTFEVSAIGRPYPDKVLFGSQQGRMRLYKIRQNKILFDFDGWDSNITVLERVCLVYHHFREKFSRYVSSR